MSENLYTVPIGEMMISHTPGDVLAARGLGSCVAICLYDPIAQIGGMLHALLPTANSNGCQGKHTKYVKQGTALLVDALLKQGAKRSRLRVYLCGGARMLSAPAFDDFGIGEHNVQAAETALQSAGLTIRAQDTGKNTGRTVKLYTATGQVTIKTLEQSEQALISNTKTQSTRAGGPYAKDFGHRR